MLIDGRDLVEIVKAVELPFAAAAGRPSRAGHYAGLELAAVAPPSRHFWGEPQFSLYGGSGVVQVLECSGCREAGCMPIFCRIEVAPDLVRWSEFRASWDPDPTDWDYTSLGPFEFERAQYEAAVSGLGASA